MKKSEMICKFSLINSDVFIERIKQRKEGKGKTLIFIHFLILLDFQLEN